MGPFFGFICERGRSQPYKFKRRTLELAEPFLVIYTLQLA
jgi:hypothetical protein